MVSASLVQEDVVTPRNQLDPRARAALLNREHLEDALGEDVKERVSAHGRGSTGIRAQSPGGSRKLKPIEMNICPFFKDENAGRGRK